MVDKKLAKELSALRLAGPFTAAPFHPFRVSPLGLIPKKTIGEFHLIHHLSFPRSSSANNGIATENTIEPFEHIVFVIVLFESPSKTLFRVLFPRLYLQIYIFYQYISISCPTVSSK
jgi:hypothetical protein